MPTTQHKGAISFDSSLCHRSSSYLVPMVNGEPMHHLRTTCFLLRIKARRPLAQGLSDEEIAEQLGVSLAAWVDCRRACAQRLVPLEDGLGGVMKLSRTLGIPESHESGNPPQPQARNSSTLPHIIGSHPLQKVPSQARRVIDKSCRPDSPCAHSEPSQQQLAMGTITCQAEQPAQQSS